MIKPTNIYLPERSLEQLDCYCKEVGLSRSKAVEYLILKERGQDLSEIPIWRAKFWDELIQEASNQKINFQIQEKDGVSYSSPFLSYVNFDFWKGLYIDSKKQRNYSLVLFITKEDIVVQLRYATRSEKKTCPLIEKFDSSTLKGLGFQIKNIKTSFVIECRKTVTSKYIPNAQDWLRRLKELDRIF